MNKLGEWVRKALRFWWVLPILAAAVGLGFVCEYHLSKTWNTFALLCVVGGLVVSVLLYRLIRAPTFLWIILAFVYALAIRGWLWLNEFSIPFPQFPMTYPGLESWHGCTSSGCWA